MKSNFSQKWWVKKQKTYLYLGSDKLKSNVSKFKGSIFAIIVGLVIGSIVIATTNNSIFTYFHYVFYFAFSNYAFNNWDNTIVWWTIYILAGLALVVAFKSGMFNIGVSGQLLAAGAVILIIGIRCQYSQPVELLIALIAGILASTLVAAVTALLKVLFNVHEVVSSILINWIILYLVKWYFSISPDLYDSSYSGSKPVNSSLSLLISGYKFILPIIFASVMVLVVWFVLNKTVFGFKIKTVGANKFAAQFAGINDKRFALSAFIFSGIIVGFMAFVYYIAINPNLSFTSDTVPALGFDSISIALVGQINAFGVVGAAVIWAVIKSGGPIGSVALQIPNAIGDLIFGVIIYSAACVILLMKVQPIRYISAWYYICSNQPTRFNFAKQWLIIFKNWKNNYLQKKVLNSKIKLAKQEVTNEADETKKAAKKLHYQELISQKHELRYSAKTKNKTAFRQMHQFLISQADYIWKNGYNGIKNAANKSRKELSAYLLDQYIDMKNNFEEEIYALKQELKQKKLAIKKFQGPEGQNTIQKLIIDFQQKVKIKTELFNKNFARNIVFEAKTIDLINQEQKKAFADYQVNKKTVEQEIMQLKKSLQQLILELKNQIKDEKDLKTNKLNFKEKVKLLKKENQEAIIALKTSLQTKNYFKSQFHHNESGV